MNPANGFKKGYDPDRNIGGRPKQAVDYLEKQLMPSLKKIAEKRDKAKDERIQLDAAKELVNKALGISESEKQPIVNNNIYLPDGHKLPDGYKTNA